ncbi:hypothetical protein ABT337_29840 [Saccharopolyspora hirsuta]
MADPFSNGSAIPLFHPQWGADSPSFRAGEEHGGFAADHRLDFWTR